MKTGLTKSIFGLFLLLAGILIAGAFPSCGYRAADELTRRVLIIHSYREDCAWGEELNRGVKECFRRNRVQAVFPTYYLDCELLLADEEIEAMNRLLQEYENRRPDLIIVCDDQATYSLLATGHPLTHQVPIVFCGVGYPNESQLAGHPNVTGFTTTPDFRKCTELIRYLYPNTSRLNFNVTSSYLSRQALQAYEKQMTDNPDTIPLRINNLETLNGLQLMWTINHGIVRPSIMPVWDSFFSGIFRNSPHPTFSVTNEGFGNGYLGGYMTPSFEQTYQAAERGIEILRGKPASDFPIVPSEQVLVFDWKEMQRYGLKPEQLPPGSRIEFMPFSVKYRTAIAFSAVLLGCLTGGFAVLLLYLYKEEKKYRQKAQKQLQEHRDKLKTVMSSINEGVISIDREMNIFAINPPAARWLRLEGSPEKYLQRNLYTLIDITAPGKKHYLREMIDILLSKNQNTMFEYATQLISLERQWSFPATGELSGIYENGRLSGMVLTFHDKTKEFTQKEFLALTLGSGNVSSWRLDIENRRIVFDKAFFHIFNVEDDGSHSIPLDDFVRMIHPEDKEKWEKMCAGVRSGKLKQYRLQLRIDFNGMGYKWWEDRLIYQPAGTPGAPPTVLGLCLNIQKFKQAEAELQQARIKAQQSDKLKSAFLANMSHEIRTPLNAIVGFSNLLTGDEEFEPEEKQLFIETIQNNCNLLLALLSDILDLARIESETMSFKEEMCDVNEMIRQIVTTQQVIIPEHLQLIREVPAETCRLKIDRLRLTQVITNLINNAIKFTEKGYVKVGYTRENDGYLHFFVEDTGKGIPEKEIGQVFGRFYKKDDSAQGAGLGLSICKMIVDHFKGDISVVSKVGAGSRFTVKIPYAATRQTTGSPAPSIPRNHSIQYNKMEKTSNEPIPNKRVDILIAEDEESNYLLLKTILQKRCNLLRARTGVEALRIFGEQPVDMILMDIKMPEMNGIDTVREIRKISKEVPIVMQSAYVFDSDMEKAEAAGANGFITKPINVKVLKETILKFFPFIEW